MKSPASTAARVLVLAFACNMFGRGIADSYLVFLLPLSGEFDWTRAEASSVYSIYLVVTGLSAPLTGMLIDRWGARVVYPLGVLLLGVGCLLAANLSQLWQFQAVIGLLGGMGVSMLGMVPASMLISRWFRDRMSTAMGVAYAGFGTGTLLVLPVAQYLIETRGWRETYELMGIASLALIPLLLFLPWRAIAGDATRRPRKGAAPTEAARTWALKEALRTRPYWQLVQVFSFTAIAMMGILAQVVPFLVESGLAPLQAATAFGIAGLLSVFGMTASGASADRIGYRATATTSFASTFAGIACLLLLSYYPAAWLVVPFVLFFGIAPPSIDHFNGYAMYFKMAGRKVGTFAGPSGSVLVFDSVVLDKNAATGLVGFGNRHEAIPIGFADGHLESFTKEKQAELDKVIATNLAIK